MTVSVTQEGPLFVAEDAATGIASQGATEDEARANLVVALALFADDETIGESPSFSPAELHAFAAREFVRRKRWLP